jgi:hypothetical protein
MRNLDFWIKTSNYSIAVSGVALIVKLFFQDLLSDIILYILFIGGSAFVVFVISEFMKFVLKRRL